MSHTSPKNNVAALSVLFAMAASVVVCGGLGLAKMGLNPLMTDPDGAVATVENAGLTHARATGYGWFSCGVGEHSDFFRTKFKAVNQNGREVTGTVCSGFLKGSTIRYN